MKTEASRKTALKSPSEARRLVERHARALPSAVLPLDRAIGRVLAESVGAPFPLPRFDNSAMDGYAVRSLDTAKARPSRPVLLAIAFEQFAGRATPRRLRPGEACLITTGAVLPRGADAVVPREEAEVQDGVLRLTAPARRGRHVRRRGEEVRRHALVLRRGASIHAGTIACLAAVGRTRVRVVRSPRVSVVATGDETVAPGRALGHGQIYDSNSAMLAAALRQMGVEPVRVRRVGDHPSALSRSVGASLARSDVLIVTGGVSVGDHDYLRPVLARLQVREVFWRVNQRPGKPLYFGVKGRRLVFGLPGNPVSAFVCFYLYVYPALRRLSGFRRTDLPSRTVTLGRSPSPDGRRWRFLKARVVGQGAVAPLEAQGSHTVASLADTTRLIAVPPAGRGRRLDARLLPHAEDDA